MPRQHLQLVLPNLSLLNIQQWLQLLKYKIRFIYFLLKKIFSSIFIYKESEELLKDTNIDTDAKTRHQSKEINKIMTKKPKLAKNSTMIATTKVKILNSVFDLFDCNFILSIKKESETLLKEADIDSDAKTRNANKAIKRLTKTPAKLKKSSTMNATAKEALDLLTREPLKASRTKKGKLFCTECIQIIIIIYFL